MWSENVQRLEPGIEQLQTKYDGTVLEILHILTCIIYITYIFLNIEKIKGGEYILHIWSRKIRNLKGGGRETKISVGTP